MKSISETLTLSELVGETASIIRVVEENEFTEDKLVALFKTFTKERKLQFPKYMGFLRIVLSGQKVRHLVIKYNTYIQQTTYNNYSGTCLVMPQY